jgi:hypothetical protein
MLAAVLCVTAFTGCESRPQESPKPKATNEPVKTVEALKPPEAKKGEPVAFAQSEFNIKDWQNKTKKDAAPWFVVKGDRWYIDWDAERQPFETIVIHHSATKPDATPDDIDAIQKERLYAPRYRSANDDPFVKGLPVHTGHVIDNKERFTGYHHLVYADGKVTTELSPLVKIENKWHVDHVGWHAGKWSVNCRSVAICLVGDFSDKEPPDAQLRATAGLIVHYRTFNPKVEVTGHGDHANTECPGKTWRTWRAKTMMLAGGE